MKITDNQTAKIRIRPLIMALVLLFNVCQPTVSLALSEGTNQPDFASFEEMGTTDMVNLVTGDFTYSIPLIYIPSPEGGFQMPLSYHAGIQKDEESSWVGLGWSVNPGVLDRNVSVYPDDYDGSQTIENNVTDPTIKGDGYIDNFLIWTDYYDSNKGWGMSVDYGNIAGLTFSDANGLGAKVLGFEANKNEVKFDFDKMVMGLYDAAGAFAPGAAKATGATGSSLQSTLFSLSQSGIQALASQYKAPASTQEHFSNGITVQTESRTDLGISRHTAYKYWLNNTSYSKPFGVLNLGNINRFSNPNTVPNNNTGQQIFNGPNFGSLSTGNQPKLLKDIVTTKNNYPVHDMHIYYEPNVAYSYQFNPSSIAYDNFNIKAFGSSGAISPYRLDAGTLSNPIASDEVHETFCFTSFMANKTNANTGGYKVPFKYAGDFSNAYDFNLTQNGVGAVTTEFATNWNNQNSNYFQVAVNNSKIYNDDAPLGNNKTGKEQNRLDQSLVNDKLVHGRHIEWYSNHEIINGQAIGFMDAGVPRTTFPANGIGGFSVTREDGLTFHFSLPVYNKKEIRRFEIGSKKYSVKNDNKYAIMWHLTGITGADFVDRGVIGQIDDADWGYWVKLDYGMYNSNYMWRTPYYGWNISPNGNKELKRGVKEKYYLNTIRTRTHTGLFVKSVKSDGKSYYESDNVDIGDNVAGYSQPSVSLRLDDIYVLKNEAFDKMKQSTSQGGFNLFNFNHTNSLNWTDNIVTNINANVVLLSDVSSIPVKQYLQQNQTSHFKFNYSYKLCPRTLNSVNLEQSSPSTFNYPYYSSDYMTQTEINKRQGKLTLESLEILGSNDARLMPKYDFVYGNTNDPNENPPWSFHQWDDYGMFKPEGGNDGTTPHNPGPSGAQWSLKKIISPLGGSLEIEYERDTYSSVNGYNCITDAPINVPAVNIPANILNNRIFVNSQFGSVADHFAVGDQGFFSVPASAMNSPARSFYFVITALNTTQNYFDFNITQFNPPTVSLSQVFIHPFLSAAQISIFKDQKYGGNLRVKTISTLDELGNKYVTKYDYSMPQGNKTITSGVASYETNGNKVNNFAFYKYYDHPYTPIMYKQITVSHGRYNGNVFEENNKTVYKFTTPRADMLSVDAGQVTYNSNSTTYGGGTYFNVYDNGTTKGNNSWKARSGHVAIFDRTSQIGNIEEITTYNPRNEAIAQEKYKYTSELKNTNMGKYGETNFIFEYFKDDVISDNANSNYTYTYRLFQTTKIKYPNILTSVSSNMQGIVSDNSTVEWDFKTSKPTKIYNRIGGPNGTEHYMTEFVLAHTKYPEMGSKALNPNYKNMMIQNTQEKLWVNVKNSPANSSYKLLSSEVTTFDKNQNYRQYNSSTNNFYTGPLVTNAGEIAPYQLKNQYVWKSGVDKDGTIKASDYQEYNWSSVIQNAGWIKTAEAKLYNKYSKLLEGNDINYRPLSMKFSSKESYPVATLNNCNYGEWCFSGAEDVSYGSTWFGGEVGGGHRQFKTGSAAHTGNYSLKCADGEDGFSFTGLYGTDFKPGKTYRASVWVFNPLGIPTANDAVLYANVTAAPVGNNPPQVLYTANTVFYSIIQQKYGSWYKFDLDITIPQTSSMSGTPYAVYFGCKNPISTGGSTIYFDDFRVHPLSNAFDAKVTDPKTGNVVAILDKENIATRYYYDDANKLIRCEKETRDGFIKLSEYSYHYKK